MAAMARDDRKRKQYNDDADEDGDRRGRRDKRPKEEKPAPPLPSEIRNKEKRNEVYVKVKHEKKAQKRKLGRERVQAAELVEQVPEKQVPRMIENTREPDETVCRHDDQEVCGLSQTRRYYTKSLQSEEKKEAYNYFQPNGC